MAAKKPAVAKTKKPGLDIKDEMYWTDKKKFNWLDEQPEDMRKSFSPLVAMKWFSVPRSDAQTNADYIMATNEFVNIGFWEMSKHPDLIWRLMCGIGEGRAIDHGWIAMASTRKAIPKVNQMFLNLYPHLNDEEINLLKSKFDPDSFKQLLRDQAMPDAEMKPLVEEFKKTNG